MNVLIRVDSSCEVGSGHAMRCLTLAEQLKEKGAHVIFISGNAPGNLNGLIRGCGFTVFEVDSNLVDYNDFYHFQLIELCLKLFGLMGKIDYLVIDSYKISFQFEKMLRAISPKIVVIDDLADKCHDCDILLNQNYGATFEGLYAKLLPANCITLIGTSYMLLRPEFFEIKKSDQNIHDPKTKRILIFMGGADILNLTSVILKEFKDNFFPELAFDVVVGSSNHHIDSIREICATIKACKLHINTNNMAQLIANAHIGVGAAGSSMWERCYLGLPTITVGVAENQYQIADEVAKAGAIYYLGDALNLPSGSYRKALNFFLDNPNKLNQMKNIAKKIVHLREENLATVMFKDKP